MCRLNQKAKSSDPMKRKKKTPSLSGESSLSLNSNESQSSSFSNDASVRNAAIEGPSIPALSTLNRNDLHFLHELYQNSPNSNASQSSSFSNDASVRNAAIEGPSIPAPSTLNRNNLHFLHELYQNRTLTQYQTHRVETFGVNGVQPLSMPQAEIYSSLPQLADLNSNVLPLTDSLYVYQLQHLQWQQHLIKERIKHHIQLVGAGIISAQPQPQNRLYFENLFSAL